MCEGSKGLYKKWPYIAQRLTIGSQGLELEPPLTRW
jgi:hypothetical protein